MIGIMIGSIAVFGIIYYFVTLLPEGEGRRQEILFSVSEIPLFCPKCKEESLINAEKFIVKEARR